MPIKFDKNTNKFHIYSENMSYVMDVYNGERLTHLYYGKRINNTDIDFVYHSTVSGHCPDYSKDNYYASLCVLPLEYSSFGGRDLRYPSFIVETELGTIVCEPKFKDYKIFKGKNRPKGLPYAMADEQTETLEITLTDEAVGLDIILIYNLFPQYDAITRSVKFVNIGSKTLKLKKCASMSLDFFDADLNIIHSFGYWAKENNLQREPVSHNRKVIDTLSGRSGYNHSPFFVLCDKSATETSGNVYGFNLLYSGNFEASVEIDQSNVTRAIMGISPTTFEWNLSDSFQTPECLMIYSENGLEEMSHKSHKIFNENIIKSKFKNTPRPVLINNWEATYFDFTEQKLLDLAKTAAKLGIELFVLDDGWFGKRNDSSSSLGDWYVNKQKIPSGIEGLSKKINDLGMQFGIWIEPEMVSPDSDLYRAHPDWVLSVPTHESSLSRGQWVLDLTREDVCEYIKTALDNVIASGNISYIKWDMNRYLSEVGSSKHGASQQGELYHRYVLGLYDIMEYITEKYPDVLLEGCSGGGGRYDGGILHYMPQIWTSDDTDAVERLSIQKGASLFYPVSAISAHYSITPNHQTGRSTTAEMRAFNAMYGAFGYELDLNKLSEQELLKIKTFTEIYKKDRADIINGKYYRLQVKDKDNAEAWMTVSTDKKRAIFNYSNILNHMPGVRIYVKLRGLEGNSLYKITDSISGESKSIYGDQLMNIGLPVKMLPDFTTYRANIEKIK